MIDDLLKTTHANNPCTTDPSSRKVVPVIDLCSTYEETDDRNAKGNYYYLFFFAKLITCRVN